MRLLNTATGELVPGACSSTNRCSYCAKRFARETCEMLWLDATEQGSPELWLLLTTSESEWDADRFMRALEHVWRAVRRRWPAAEYAALVEFTTGYGRKSGGLRRPHWNVFVRGVPVEDAVAFRRVVRSVWCARVSASPRYQCVYSVSEDKGGMRGLSRYVALHFLKESQAPPVGWSGQRFRATRGYFVRPRMQLREEARRSLRVQHLARQGMSSDAIELELREREAITWELRHVRASTIEAVPVER